MTKPSRKRRRVTLQDMVNETAPASAIGRTLRDLGTEERIAIVELLTGREREVIELRSLERMSHEQIAERLNICVDDVVLVEQVALAKLTPLVWRNHGPVLVTNVFERHLRDAARTINRRRDKESTSSVHCPTRCQCPIRTMSSGNKSAAG